MHSLGRLLVVLGVVSDEGSVLVEVAHKVIIVLELAESHHRVRPGDEIPRGAVTLYKIKLKVGSYICNPVTQYKIKVDGQIIFSTKKLKVAGY